MSEVGTKNTWLLFIMFNSDELVFCFCDFILSVNPKSYTHAQNI